MIAGAPGAFCAGNDLEEFRQAAASGEGLGDSVIRFLHALAYCERPLVAAVDGLAIGVGTTMLLHCDYVVASRGSRFATPFVGLGLVPEAASSLLAPRLMGPRRAFALLVMGEPMDAPEAKACGLVNVVVAPEAVDQEGLRAARTIAALPREAVMASRRLMRGSPEEIHAQIDAEAETAGVTITSLALDQSPQRGVMVRIRAPQGAKLQAALDRYAFRSEVQE